MKQIRSILPAHQEPTAIRHGDQAVADAQRIENTQKQSTPYAGICRTVGPVCTGFRVAVRTGRTLSGRAVGDAAGRTEVGPGGGPPRGLEAGEEQPHRLL